ncbi:hypothetical protein M406DRAFT_102808 [Cryphonectria parasitica EP155]|uniref:Uncharacterized protein n=1 Tax=Cryphonectria parasitica (strain ATCC 38755 / EP155) TaxID=660469 RepID=A0A9P4Y945_CRYP1|nr:uncharacterized protein M406DRAFT_102808 [Cryphonectria parasitica EP155]KAF3768715.1 hypothetical protein M406DRAFT_102808 [Cryphonectria parasitica EP155]
MKCEKYYASCLWLVGRRFLGGGGGQSLAWLGNQCPRCLGAREALWRTRGGWRFVEGSHFYVTTTISTGRRDELGFAWSGQRSRRLFCESTRRAASTRTTSGTDHLEALPKLTLFTPDKHC